MTDTPYKGDVCPARHAFILDNVIRRLFQRPKRIAGPYIHPGDTIIDLGCGPGFFTIDMADLTGPQGRVIAVDLQKEMLDRLAAKTASTRLSDRIRLHHCRPDTIALGPDVKADFILAFYMMHETPDRRRTLKELKPHLKETGCFLIVEPFFHVSKPQFETTARYAEETGWRIVDRPKKKGGRSLLLRR